MHSNFPVQLESTIILQAILIPGIQHNLNKYFYCLKGKNPSTPPPITDEDAGSEGLRNTA